VRMAGRIAFTAEPWSEDPTVIVLVPVADEVPLTDLVHEYERRSGFEERDQSYGGLIPAFFNFGTAHAHFLGGDSGRIPLLGCACGEWGCWPIMGPSRRRRTSSAGRGSSSRTARSATTPASASSPSNATTTRARWTRSPTRGRVGAHDAAVSAGRPSGVRWAGFGVGGRAGRAERVYGTTGTNAILITLPAPSAVRS
jgi:hypothetical protein